MLGTRASKTTIITKNYKPNLCRNDLGVMGSSIKEFLRPLPRITQPDNSNPAPGLPHIQHLLGPSVTIWRRPWVTLPPWQQPIIGIFNLNSCQLRCPHTSLVRPPALHFSISVLLPEYPGRPQQAGAVILWSNWWSPYYPYSCAVSDFRPVRD